MKLPSWLQERRSEAKVLYEQHAKPSLRYGLTIRLNTKGLELRGKEETHSEQIVTMEFEGCEARNLFDALDEPLVQEHLLTTLPAERTVFDDFTRAFFDMGLLIIVRKGDSARVDLTRTLASDDFKGHVLVIVEEGGKLDMIDKYSGEQCRLNANTVEVVAGRDAHVRYASIQALSENCFDLTSYCAKASGTGAKIDWFIGSIGGKLTHANVDTRLIGAASRARSFGVFLGTNEQQFDLSASSFHTGNESYSDMFTRGVLLGKSKAVYRGNIDIAAEAFDCNGYQTEETLLIGDDSVADAIPNLEIRNNQVSCSHGATIGRIDDEQLFYLESRGVKKDEAIKMVIEGYFEPVTRKLEWPELYSVLSPLVKEIIA